jgi:threonine 3-dehydrogenase
MSDKISALTFDAQQDQWEKSRGFVKREVPRPTIDEAADPEDALRVILKVKFAGVCGSDRGIWYRNAFRDMIHDSLRREGKTTRILGHEFVGEVVAAGSMVERLYADPDPNNPAKVAVGSLVSGDSHVTCGRCFNCRIGEAHVCMNDAILGVSIDGIFAPYVKVPAKNLWPVDPARIRPEVAALFDPFGNAVHATTAVDVRGARVAVFGCGQIGLFSILLLKYFGAAKIIGVDPNPANLALAEQLGAHETMTLTPATKTHDWEPDAAVVERLMALTYGKGVDVSLELAGYNSSVNNALESTRRGGHVVLFGIKDGDVTIPRFSRTIVKGLTLHAIIGRRIFATWQTAQRMLSDSSNGIQGKLWNVVLKGGQGTVVPFESFSPAAFEASLAAHPKLLLQLGG